MWKLLDSGSLQVDWNDNNTNQITQLTHTIGDVIMMMLPLILMHLFRNYSRAAIRILQVLLVVIGIFNVYVNVTATLSQWFGSIGDWS